MKGENFNIMGIVGIIVDIPNYGKRYFEKIK